ncbi:hypothetical protein CPT34_24245 [Rhizobium sophoriradicis]|uniref:Uncharacterized protein n=1 Tax=Rhizobium sophoriradicis TaxID=1535245 RepID=A0A2A5KNP0_9HYPH|nr:hypothetical protein CPT34_24245 [Rhizobium sophoriradicis]
MYKAQATKKEREGRAASDFAIDVNVSVIVNLGSADVSLCEIEDWLSHPGSTMRRCFDKKVTHGMMAVGGQAETSE